MHKDDERIASTFLLAFEEKSLACSLGDTALSRSAVEADQTDQAVCSQRPSCTGPQVRQGDRARYRLRNRDTDREVNDDLTAFTCHCHGKLLSFSTKQ
jgi:hypothetical protein